MPLPLDLRLLWYFKRTADLARLGLPNELQHERLAWIKFLFSRYLDVFLPVVYIIGQFRQLVIRVLDIPIDLA